MFLGGILMNNYYPNYNQFYGQMQMPKMQPTQPVQPVQPMQPVEQYQPQQIYKQIGLQGKSVDSIDVVKAMDIPLDGSVSYFPLVDGTAIVTKQLQADGTSKTVVYKPIEDKEIANVPTYITKEDFDKEIKKIDNSGIKDDIKTLKRKIEDLVEDLKDIKKGKD